MLDGTTEQEGMWRISQLGVYITAYDVVMVIIQQLKQTEKLYNHLLLNPIINHSSTLMH